MTAQSVIHPCSNRSVRTGRNPNKAPIYANHAISLGVAAVTTPAPPKRDAPPSDSQCPRPSTFTNPAAKRDAQDSQSCRIIITAACLSNTADSGVFFRPAEVPTEQALSVHYHEAYDTPRRGQPRREEELTVKG